MIWLCEVNDTSSVKNYPRVHLWNWLWDKNAVSGCALALAGVHSQNSHRCPRSYVDLPEGPNLIHALKYSNLSGSLHSDILPDAFTETCGVWNSSSESLWIGCLWAFWQPLNFNQWEVIQGTNWMLLQLVSLSTLACSWTRNSTSTTEEDPCCTVDSHPSCTRHGQFGLHFNPLTVTLGTQDCTWGPRVKVHPSRAGFPMACDSARILF